MSSKPIITAKTAEELALMWLSAQDTANDSPKQFAERFVNAYDEMLDVIAISKSDK